MITSPDAFSKLHAIISWASIISNVIVKLTISRNNILKKKPIYVYILSVLFNNTLYLLWREILRINWDVFTANTTFFQVWLEILWIFQVGNILTLIALTLQYPVRRDNYVRFLMGIWTFVIAFSIIFTIITVFAFDFFFESIFILTVVLFIMFFVLLVVQVVCRVIYRKERGDYALQLNFVSVYICCHVLYQFWSFIKFLTDYSDTNVLDVMLLYVGVYVSCYGVVNAISLLFFDRKYKICFLETIKCSKTKYFDTHESETPDETLLTTHNAS